MSAAQTETARYNIIPQTKFVCVVSETKDEIIFISRHCTVLTKKKRKETTESVYELSVNVDSNLAIAARVPEHMR